MKPNEETKPAPSLLDGLNADQRNGVACIYCGKTDCPLVPVPGLESPESAQLFRCETCKPNQPWRTEPMKTETEAALYACPNLPASWVVRLDGALWIVPAIANGWEARTEYKGHAPEAAGFDLVPLNRAMGCGIPWPASGACWVAVAADLEGPAWGVGATAEAALADSLNWWEEMTPGGLVAVQITPESFQRVKDGNLDAWEELEDVTA